jgi:hypothetical protein
MAYVSPTTRSAGYVAGATQWNEFVMDHRWVNESTTDGRPMCWAYRSSAYTVANGTSTPVPWNTNVTDNAGCHSTTVNPSRLIAPIDGWYRIESCLRWQADLDGIRIADIVPNGTGIVHTREGPTPLGAIFDAGQTVGANVRLSAGQYCEIVAYHSAGNPLDLLGTALWGAWVSFEWVRTL